MRHGISMNPPTPAQRAKFQQKVVDAFNKLHPVGTLVSYWRGLKTGDPSGTGKTKYAAQLLSGHTAVVWIEGCSGCISLSHVEVRRDADPCASQS